MKAIRYLATALLALTSVLHLYFLAGGATPENLVTAAFGLAYLIIGFFIWRESHSGYYAGVVVPAIGGMLGLETSLSSPAGLSTMMTMLIAIDVVVILGCIYLLAQARRTLPLPR